MKKNIKSLLLLLVTIFTVVGCQKVEKTTSYLGDNNYISCFSLTVDSVKYTAAILDGEVSFNLPEDLDISNSVVSYTISEQAVIAPKPEEVADWNSEKSFTVTSYSGKEREYSVKVNRYALDFSENVLLNSQSDLDAFASAQIDKVAGHVTIGNVKNSDDPIVDLSPLASLKRVEGNLLLGKYIATTDFSGLASLEYAANLSVQTIVEQPTEDDAEPLLLELNLASLSEVGEVEINSSTIKNIVLPNLKKAYSISVVGAAIDSVSLDMLESVTSDVTFATVSTLKTLSMPTLSSMGGNLSLANINKLDSLNVVSLSSSGNISIAGASQLTTIDFSALSSCGSINLKSLSTVDSLVLLNLESVNGSFTVGNTKVSQINLPELQSVNGDVSLTYNNLITEVVTPKLAQISGEFAMSGSTELKSIDLSKISQLKSVDISSSYQLETMALPKSVGNLSLNGIGKAESLPIFSGIEEVTGTLELSSYGLSEEATVIASIKKINVFDGNSSKIKHLDFGSVEEIGYYDAANYDLVSLGGENITKIDSLEISYDWALTTISFPNLREISSLLSIYGASGSYNSDKSLTVNLDAFKDVEKIGAVDFGYCKSLADFSGLEKALATITEENWKVTECKYNPTYQDMLDGKYSDTTIE